MKTEEERMLFKDKIIEGKGEIRACKEIKSLQEHEKAFKILWNENEANKRMVESLNKQIQKLNGERFRLKFALDSSKKEIEENRPKEIKGTFRHIIRIVNNMEIGKEYPKTPLAKELCMSISDFNNCFFVIDKLKGFNYEITKDGKYKRI